MLLKINIPRNITDLNIRHASHRLSQIVRERSKPLPFIKICNCCVSIDSTVFMSVDKTDRYDCSSDTESKTVDNLLRMRTKINNLHNSCSFSSLMFVPVTTCHISCGLFLVLVSVSEAKCDNVQWLRILPQPTSTLLRINQPASTYHGDTDTADKLLVNRPATV